MLQSANSYHGRCQEVELCLFSQNKFGKKRAIEFFTEVKHKNMNEKGNKGKTNEIKMYYKIK